MLRANHSASVIRDVMQRGIALLIECIRFDARLQRSACVRHVEMLDDVADAVLHAKYKALIAWVFVIYSDRPLVQTYYYHMSENKCLRRMSGPTSSSCFSW